MTLARTCASPAHAIFVGLLLLTSLLARATSHKAAKYIPKPKRGNLAAINSIRTGPSQQLLQQVQDSKLLTPAAVKTFLRRLEAALKTGDITQRPWQALDPYAYALPTYLRGQGLDAVLQLMRQLASGAKVPKADKKLRAAAAQIDPAAFAEWARKLERPASPPPRPSAPRKGPPTRPPPALSPIKPITDIYAQFADWVKRLHSLGGSVQLLSKDLSPPAPARNNANLNVGLPTFKPRVIGLVFHMMLFQDKQGNLYPPQAYWNGAEPARRMVKIINQLYRYSGTNVQFYIKQYRTNTTQYPYLKYKSLLEWQGCASQERCTCKLASSRSFLPNRHINIYVMGSYNYYGMFNQDAGFGFSAAIPGHLDGCHPTGKWDPKVSLKSQHIWLLWDRFDPLFGNSIYAYNGGPSTLAHELGHVLGLFHTHNEYSICLDTDYVADTSIELAVQAKNGWDVQLKQLCADLVYAPLRRDDITEFDSCPQDQLVDNVFNIMSYSPPNCRFMFTRGQVVRLQQIVSLHLPGYGR